MSEDEEVVFGLSMRAAAYMRWFELRFRDTPSMEQRLAFIKKLANHNKLAHTPGDLQTINYLAIAMPIDAVEDFVKKDDYFADLDRQEGK